MSYLANNAVLSRNNLAGSLNINVGPFLPFHPLHFLFFHSFYIVPRVQKFDKYTRKLILGKMKGRVNKEKHNGLCNKREIDIELLQSKKKRRESKWRQNRKQNRRDL